MGNRVTYEDDTIELTLTLKGDAINHPSWPEVLEKFQDVLKCHGFIFNNDTNFVDIVDLMQEGTSS